MSRLVDIHPEDPQPRLVAQVADRLRRGDLVALPTDSGHALAGRLDDQSVKDRIAAIRRLDDRHHYTLLCRDFAQLGQLVHVDNRVFRAVRAATPGPYTFILPATKEVPRRLLHPKKRTVGVRIPDHRVAQALLAELGQPLLVSTLLLPGEDSEPATPETGWEVTEAVGHAVDVVVDGEVSTRPTTVVDLSGPEPVVARLGAGDPAPFES